MRMPPVLIKAIRQTSNHAFTIDWADGTSHEYHLSHLQKKCPCALCFDFSAGRQNEQKCDPEVRAVRIKSVGRYALKVEFTSGCSRGIYSYAFLRELLKES